MLKQLRAWFTPSNPTSDPATQVAQHWTRYLPCFTLLNAQAQVLSQPPMYGDVPVALLPNQRVLWETDPIDEPITAINLRFGTYCRANDCHITVVIAGHSYRFHALDWEDNASVTLNLTEALTCDPNQRIRIEIYSDDAKPEQDAVVALWCSLQPPSFIQNIPDQLNLGFNTDKPRISIVIPVYNKALYTYNCLLSLQQCDTDISQQIIVVDNASSDETAQMLAQIPGIEVISNKDNRGFVEACRQGAERAQAEFIVFLNNDTQVTENWLQAMLAIVDNNDHVGIVGSKLVYPDGRLQEAGGIIFNDASGWNYGRLQDPSDPRFNSDRKVDYCSGASLLIRHELWHQLGGFDLRYAPAYYEDTDLCFACRNAGFDVMYCHNSVVIHHEGITAGTDIQSGYKAYQAINHAKFKQKWAAALTQHCPPPPEIDPDEAAQRLN